MELCGKIISLFFLTNLHNILFLEANKDAQTSEVSSQEPPSNPEPLFITAPEGGNDFLNELIKTNPFLTNLINGGSLSEEQLEKDNIVPLKIVNYDDVKTDKNDNHDLQTGAIIFPDDIEVVKQEKSDKNETESDIDLEQFNDPIVLNRFGDNSNFYLVPLSNIPQTSNYGNNPGYYGNNANPNGFQQQNNKQNSYPYNNAQYQGLSNGNNYPNNMNPMNNLNNNFNTGGYNTIPNQQYFQPAANVNNWRPNQVVSPLPLNGQLQQPNGYNGAVNFGVQQPYNGVPVNNVYQQPSQGVNNIANGILPHQGGNTDMPIDMNPNANTMVNPDASNHVQNGNSQMNNGAIPTYPQSNSNWANPQNYVTPQLNTRVENKFNNPTLPASNLPNAGQTSNFPINTFGGSNQYPGNGNYYPNNNGQQFGQTNENVPYSGNYNTGFNNNNNQPMYALVSLPNQQSVSNNGRTNIYLLASADQLGNNKQVYLLNGNGQGANGLNLVLLPVNGKSNLASNGAPVNSNLG